MRRVKDLILKTITAISAAVYFILAFTIENREPTIVSVLAMATASAWMIIFAYSNFVWEPDDEEEKK